MRRTAPPTSKRRPVVFLILKLLLALGGVTVVACVFVLLTMKWHWPTTVNLSLASNRVTFNANGINSTEAPVLGQFGAESLTVSLFENIRLYPSKIEVADPAQFDLESGGFKESAWQAINLKRPEIMIQAGDPLLNPSVTVTTGDSNGGSLLSVYPMLVKSNSNVVLQMPTIQGVKVDSVDPTKPRQSTELRVLLKTPDADQDVLIDETFLLNARHCKFEGLESPFPYKQSVSYRITLEKDRSAIRVRGLSNSLALVFMVPEHQAGNLFPKSGLTMMGLEFFREAPQTKSIESSLAKGAEGTLMYPDYPKIPKITFKFPESLRLDRDNEFVLKEMSLKPDLGAVFLELTGRTTTLYTGVPGLEENERYISIFTVLQQNPIVLALIGIVGWVVPASLSVRKFFKELIAESEPTSERTTDSGKKPRTQSARQRRRRN